LAGTRSVGSLSGLTESAAKSGKTVHFFPYSGTNRTTIRLKSVKNRPRHPFFRFAPSPPTLPDKGDLVMGVEVSRLGDVRNIYQNLLPKAFLVTINTQKPHNKNAFVTFQLV